ncbi:MAG TPA: hypothetical protein VHO68_13265 [Bacteroidales bacterium]|nr:hypothetical protein [Bacteroidales bacterium]
MKKAILLLLISTILACAPDYGNGSEIGNAKVVGKLVEADGTPACGVEIHLFEENYVPASGSFKQKAISGGVGDNPIYTDNNGAYSIQSIDSGVYNIIGISNTDQSVFIKGIEVKDIGVVKIPTDTIMDPGKIRGVTFMPGLDSINQIRVTMYLQGTDFYTKPYIGGVFSFSKIPAGSYTLIFDPTNTDYLVKLLQIEVLSGDVVDLDTVVLKKRTD